MSSGSLKSPFFTNTMICGVGTFDGAGAKIRPFLRTDSWGFSRVQLDKFTTHLSLEGRDKLDEWSNNRSNFSFCLNLHLLISHDNTRSNKVMMDESSAVIRCCWSSAHCSWCEYSKRTIDRWFRAICANRDCQLKRRASLIYVFSRSAHKRVTQEGGHKNKW